jgi:hypothetical protein
MKKWIAGAIKHPGSLRKALHAKAGKPIAHEALVKAAHRPGKIGQKARLAITLRSFGH